jgi:hypothetical protein
LLDIHVTRAACAHAAASVFDVDAVLHRELEQALACGPLDGVEILRLPREAFGVFKVKRHGNNIRAVWPIGMLQVHREG